jgi:Holliday junction DNA helicase RuvA
MISELIGKIINKENSRVVVLTTGGVGYEVNVSPILYLELKKDSEVQLPVYLAIRENSMELYGFENLEQKDLFMKFLEVNGIGPKSALHLLSLGTVAEISSAIARGDVEYLTKVSGVGRKTAERIVVELKSKIKNQKSKVGEGDESGTVLSEVIDALVSLGYSKEEARLVVKDLDGEGKTSEKLLKEALKRVK